MLRRKVDTTHRRHGLREGCTTPVKRFFPAPAPLVCGLLILFCLSAAAQSDKYANVEGYADSVVLVWLQHQFPKDKLAHYDVMLNGKMTRAKNYYDYQSFAAPIGDTVFQEATPATENTTGNAAVSRPADSALSHLATPPPHDSALAHVLPVFVDSGYHDSAVSKKTISTDSAALQNNALSITNSELNYQFVLKDSARGIDPATGMADSTNAAPGPAQSSGIPPPTDTSSASSPSSAPATRVFTVAKDTFSIVNFGPNTGRNGCFMLVVLTRGDKRKSLILGVDPFQEEFYKLQAFTEEIGRPLQKYLVEVWDLFIKCRQQVVFTPLYIHS